MKKMLSIFLVLSFGFNLTANDNLIKSKKRSHPFHSLTKPNRKQFKNRRMDTIYG